MDPQLDANALIKILAGEANFLAFAQANHTAGLSYNAAVRTEFLANGLGTQADLDTLAQTWGIIPIADVSEPEIDTAASRLQGAFHGASLGRVLDLPDARVLATALLKNESVATHDLRLFKRARDLGLSVVFVGSGRAATQAAAYAPQPVTIPGGP
jgi:predicted nucleic acid-binding protein